MDGPTVGRAFVNLAHVFSVEHRGTISGPPYLTVVSMGRPFNAFSGTSVIVAIGFLLGTRGTWSFSLLTRWTVTCIVPSC